MKRFEPIAALLVVAALIPGLAFVPSRAGVLARPQATATSFHFVFSADSRDDYSVLPDFSHKMLTLGPIAGFFGGDLCGSFSTTCINNTWKPAMDGNNNDGMLARTFVGRGNHDSGTLSTWQGLWDFQTTAALVGATNFSALTSDATYSFDYGNSHFAMIDVPGGGSNTWTSSEISWLDADLTAAEGRGAVHEFLFAHGPMYGVTSEHGSEAPSSALKGVLNKHPISAGFHGHEHVTQYTHVTPSVETGINSYQEFTMGRAGAPPYSVTKPTDWHADQNAFADVAVNGNDFTVTVYSQSGSALFSKTFTDAPAATCTLAGNAGIAGATLSYQAGNAMTATADGSGNYSFTVPAGWSGAVTPSQPGSCFSPDSRTYSNVRSDQASQNYTPDTACTNSYISGGLQGSYSLPAGSSMRRSYTNVDAGPVQLLSSDGTTLLIASERINLKGGAGASSYSEFMGVPGSKLSDTYLFPWYSNAAAGGVSSELRFGNVGGSSTTVTVTVAGTVRGTYPLGINETARVTYANMDNGPVQIHSSGSVPIVASVRVSLKKMPQFSSYTELLGLSASSTASTKYMFPWYNNASSGGLDSQLRFGNVGGDSTTVTIKIGGVVKGTYPLDPNQSTRVAYNNVDNGPVEISSSGGVPIIASQRMNLKTMPSFNSYTELMGLPGISLTETRYVFPIYTDTAASGLEGQLRFANVGSLNTTVTVKIGGVVQGTYGLIPNASNRVTINGLDTGPVEVFTANGVPIIASMRVNLAPNATYSSNAEMMGLSMGTGLGLPGNQLSSSYWFPWYNNATYGGLDSQLRFGIP